MALLRNNAGVSVTLLLREDRLENALFETMILGSCAFNVKYFRHKRIITADLPLREARRRQDSYNVDF